MVRVIHLTALLVLLGTLLPAPAQAQPRYQFDRTETLLPKTVVPRSVDVLLDVDPERDSFSGRATWQVQVRRSVDALELHAEGLQFGESRLVGAGAGVPLQVQADAAKATWRLTRSDGRPFSAGRQNVEMSWTGQVRVAGEALYRVDHGPVGGRMRMLATQLQATHARSVLPLWDEPAFRISVSMQVRAPAAYKVLSNMPAVDVAAEGPTRLHRFAPTPPMPGYLLALAVGRLDKLEGRVGQLPLRIFTVPGKAAQGAFALEASQQLIPYYESYFGQRYALPKLDQLAVPGVRQGAMEDWGLISYEEASLLVDPGRSSDAAKRRVFGLIAHEVSHQWFGNLVSPAGWSEIWLNEAFATWMERKAADQLHPEWQTALQLRRHLEGVLDRDATDATRPIRGGPVSEASVFEVFDNVTYGKGGAVLSMLEQWLGPQTFQRGLQRYMAERRMQPATAGDLWHHMGRAASQPVRAVAASWTDQPGLPLVRVEATCEAGRTRLTLSQERFSAGAALPPATWQVPVRLLQGSRERMVLLSTPQMRLDWPGCDEAPLLANAGGVGYYRVAYDSVLAARLAARFGQLAAVDQVSLLADGFALARAGRQPLAVYLDLLQALPSLKEPARTALYSLALQQLRELEVAFRGSPAEPALQRGMRALFAPALEALGWQPAPGEDAQTQALRANLILALARLGHEATQKAAVERFDAALPASSPLPPDIRRAVLGAGALGADATRFDQLLQAMKQADSERERWLLANALAQVQQPGLALRLLDAAVAGELPRLQAGNLPGAVAENPLHGERVYEHVRRHWTAWSALAGDGVFGGRNWLLPQSASQLADAAWAERLRTDQRALAGPAGASTAARVGARIEARQRLREREADRTAQLLSRRYPQDPP